MNRLSVWGWGEKIVRGGKGKGKGERLSPFALPLLAIFFTLSPNRELDHRLAIASPIGSYFVTLNWKKDKRLASTDCSQQKDLET